MALGEAEILADEHLIEPEHRAPTDEIGKRCKLPFEPPAKPLVLAEMVDEDDLTPRLADPLQFPHHARRLRDYRHDIHGDDRVEALVGKGERTGIHLVQGNDVVELFALHLVFRLVQHLRGKIDAGDGEMATVAGEREPGADAHLQHPSLPPIDDADGVLAPRLGNQAEGEVIDRCPAAIGMTYGSRVHYGCLVSHVPSPTSKPPLYGRLTAI